MSFRPVDVLELRDTEQLAVVRRRVDALAQRVGLGSYQRARLVTAVGEIARNALTYGGGGRVRLEVSRGDNRVGVRIIVRDKGPGIPDVSLAMERGFSTGGSMGVGLPGAKALVDDFEMTTSPRGTRIMMTSWSR